ncbi:MAG: hypothetical protein QM728_11560 [Gordonia sp. (in: high G+C Gram-positive bacteria)]|uniref:hypothetical protein n=1 Tax=Gordonia sp. (in: high G+C Gram-positive bacteria) TaxID=84139 RepID=UPI0039E2BA5A
MSRRRVLVVLTVVLTLIAAGAWWRASADHRVEDPARAEVMAAAARTTTALMTRKADDQPVLPSAAKNLTGRLADEYASQGADVVLPGAVEEKMAMTARVVGTGTAEIGINRARVLVFVDLWARPADADREIPRVALARWASMRKVDGTWLLAGLTPVTGTLS